MQNYINPIELLSLETTTNGGFDNLAIRKAKKHLLADIELSENQTITHNGIELTKSDCIKAIDDLDYKDKRDFHLFIFENSDLNNFLSSGDLNFFRTFKTESIYKLPDFIDFISPYFSVQYAKALSRNFKTNNFNNVKYLLSVKPLVNDNYLEDCYKSTYATLKEIENEIIKITKDIEVKKSEHIKNDFSELPYLIKQKANVDLINLLPSYFQSLRNQFAQSVRYLARDINNEPYNLYKPAFEIVEIANLITTEGLVKQNITKGYYIIKKNYEDSIPQIKSSSNLQSTTSSQLNPVEIKDDNIVSSKHEKKESSNTSYYLFFIAFNAIGFFYNPVQKIVLGLSLLMLLIPLLSLSKEKDFFTWKYLKWDILSITVASLGFFYSLIAQLYISYHCLIYINLLFDAIIDRDKVKKGRFGFWHYAIGAMLITALYYNYYTESKTTPSNSSEITNQELTDKEHFQKGHDFFQQSNFNDAINEYNKAINLNPNYVDAYGDRGASKANIGQYEAAIIDYQKAEELGMNTSILYSNLGYAYYKLKQSDKALVYLEKAIELNPQNGNAYRWRGEIKYDKDDNKGAAEDYTKAILNNPIASNYFARGLAYYYLKDYSTAIEDMSKAIELTPNASQYYYDRGDAKDKINDFDGACKDWKTAKDKGYDVPEYKINRCTPQIIDVTNGELSGCPGLKPRYNRGLNNKLLITVGSSASVAVKLIEVTNEKCIRYVFINKNSTYSIKNIPEGRYYLKIAYGDEWGIMDGLPNGTGKFTKNSLFEKGEEILDYNLVKSGNEYKIPSFSLKLDVIITEENKNSFNTNKINENDFYNE